MISEISFNELFTLNSFPEQDGAMEHYRQAIDLLNQLGEIVDPEMTDPGTLALFQEAIDHLDAAIRLDPSYPGFYNLKGQIYVFLGQTSEAMEYFSKAIELDPAFSDDYCSPGDALVGRAICRLFQWNLNDAIADLQAAEALGNEDAKELLEALM
jgi:tetratricopeptide (TPR) repeat protein